MDALTIGIIIFIVILILGSCTTPDTRRRQSRLNSRNIIVKRSGKQKKYRVNRYGEVFED